MPEENSCCCGADVVLVLACSGAANVGQMTNEAGKRLHAEGSARLFCLSGVGGHVSGMVASVKGSDKVLVLDGCQVGCARKCLEEVGVSDYEYLVVTELGIEKKKSFDVPEEDVERAMAAARRKLGVSAKEPKEA